MLDGWIKTRCKPSVEISLGGPVRDAVAAVEVILPPWSFLLPPFAADAALPDWVLLLLVLLALLVLSGM